MFRSQADVIDYFEHCEFVASLPKRISPNIIGFCDSLDANPPAFVDVHPAQSARLMQCFGNVAAAVAEGYGEMQTGWLIWEYPETYLVAERHAVLKTHEGLIDLTPQPEGYRRVLFAPTSGPPPSGFTPCRYLALKDHPLVHRFVRLMARNQVLLENQGFRTREFCRNDAEAANSLRNFLALKRTRQFRDQVTDRRAKRKAERQRRRRARR